MASHLIFKSPSGDIVKVKTGFSWQAFFVGSLRSMIKRTWVLLGLVALGVYLLWWIDGTPTASSRNVALLIAFGVVCLCYMLFCGFQGNRWRVDSLLRRGFRQVGEDKPEPASSRRRSTG